MRSAKHLGLAPVPLLRVPAGTRSQIPAGRHHQDRTNGGRGNRDFNARQIADEVSEPCHLMRSVNRPVDPCHRDLAPALTDMPKNLVPKRVNSPAPRSPLQKHPSRWRREPTPVATTLIRRPREPAVRSRTPTAADAVAIARRCFLATHAGGSGEGAAAQRRPRLARSTSGLCARASRPARAGQRPLQSHARLAAPGNNP